MIRAIAAVDEQLGLSTDTGIPWSVPADVAHFRSATASTDVLMGYATYAEYARPMPGRTNYVATGRAEPLRTGFTPSPTPSRSSSSVGRSTSGTSAARPSLPPRCPWSTRSTSTRIAGAYG